MYPTNYMNPMNNQPMSPDYGYNRMQQVQQMQQAINPTVPNMFGQMNQMNNMNQQQQTPYISAIPVTCLDEAKAARISLDGTLSVFINIQDGEIYTKQLNMNGLAELKTYGAIQMGMCQGFNQTNAAIAESRFAAQQCCCETNRNIDAVRAENYKNTCEITTAIHAEAEATRALMTANVMQELRDQL